MKDLEGKREEGRGKGVKIRVGGWERRGRDKGREEEEKHKG